MTNSVSRFSNRVENYVKYRPGYPARILDLLGANCAFTKASVVADIGSGSGKLSELFLQNGNRVFAVEPNPEMRAAAERLFSHEKTFVSIAASAEATSLATHSIDFITAGQAFHWFDRLKSKTEFSRILKPNGWVVIIWNERKLDTTPFLKAYEQLLLKFGTDYQEVRHERVSTEVAHFFSPNRVILQTLENRQEFDFEGLAGRVASSSYTPDPGSTESEEMLARLREIFDQYAEDGHVSLLYDTNVYFGQLTGY